jgi:hypothetical protein
MYHICFGKSKFSNATSHKPIPSEKRVSGIGAKMARAVNGAILKDVKKRLGVGDFVKALAC